jgi:hypothetical protein
MRKIAAKKVHIASAGDFSHFVLFFICDCRSAGNYMRAPLFINGQSIVASCWRGSARRF